MFKNFRKQEGFTLVELMVVVLIIGILVAIAIPIFNNASQSAKEKTCAANIRTINGAVQQYAATNESAPTSIDDLIPAYIQEMPTCPLEGDEYELTAGVVDKTAHDATHP